MDRESFNCYIFKLGIIKKELGIKKEEVNEKTIELKELKENISKLELELEETLNLLKL